MDKNQIFQALESNFLAYADLKDVPAQDNGEGFVSLSSRNIAFVTSGDFIVPSTGHQIFVRSAVAEKLMVAQEHINVLFPHCVLQVVYGYRSLDVQQKIYEDIRREVQLAQPHMDDDAVNEEVHRFIAVPSVAGHPTGGAVDVRILNQDGYPLDMGTQAHEFVKESYNFYPFVTKTVWLNRQKLRQAMLSAGFAPFDGEWWHFSYGDKEWAKYYNKPCALYGQVNLDLEGFIIAA